ncbi:probable polygalacturonase At1g80170 [Rutidosis leptorrhynchoides]|uniref:probable polygalacturonase At1g80170 n=1 Tax=Rutidosis leptorrhynchoides TaxID=125765 RepID=UPI003A999E54
MAFPLVFMLSLVTSLVAFPFDRYDVYDYGATGLGATDDSHAFVSAWEDACKSETQSARVIVPRGTFLLNPLMFNGPCHPKTIHFIIYGTLISPSSPKTWKGLDSSQWIAFKNLTGLNVYGSGLIDGQGMTWWDQSCRYHPNQVFKTLTV